MACPRALRAQVYFTDEKLKISVLMKSNEGSFINVFKIAEF